LTAKSRGFAKAAEISDIDPLQIMQKFH